MATKGKTIKEIADELGVSKQAVSYRLKQLQTAKKDTLLAVKENGVLVVSLAAEKMIIEAFSNDDRQKDHQKDRQKEPPKDRQKEGAFLAVMEGTIKTLQDQLEIKDRQIEEMQKQLAEERRHSREQAEKLAVLADQAQRLQLAQMHPELTAGDGAEPEPEPDEPIGLFQKIFRRKQRDKT